MIYKNAIIFIIGIFEKILQINNWQKKHGMLQRLTIALAQVKVGNSSEHLLNEIRQIVSLYQSK